jgi:antitoxin VapB
MASLYIKDDETNAVVTRLAQRTGVSKTALVRDLAIQREAEMNRVDRKVSVREELERYRRENPLPPKTGKVADKAFFDEMWGED